ncbi:MAG TPA: AAA family ATPase [Kofleriaceae bacterium]|nr:AAA family ATPase [Kofleriaceae bacterium]
MKTITFYSYKGGVGRSLLVANVAKYLSILGKRVFAIDLDLEAPGLHYKFELDSEESRKTPDGGLIDVLIDFLQKKEVCRDLAPFVAELDTPTGAGSIHLMWSGEAPLGMYWRKLASVDWHHLLYGVPQEGTAFFQTLKRSIESQYQPDFLLVDARTGVTEMGGIATTLLPDVVVALALATREHLEGMRAVMHGIMHAASARPASSPILIVPVLSRLPWSSDLAADDAMTASRTLQFLNEAFGKAGETLNLSEVEILHAEPLLDSGERLLVGGKSGPHEIRLLRDYLRLFSKVIPADELRPHIGSLIESAVSRILDDPDGAQASLEELTTYCGDPAAYRALLKLYRVTKAPLEKVMTAAATMWHLGAAPADPLLVDIVQKSFSEPRAVDVQRKHAELGEAVWRATGGKDVNIALTLVNCYLPDQRERALKVLREYAERVDPPHPRALAKLVDLLRATASMRADAQSFVTRFKSSAAVFPEFLAAWARLVAELRSADAARKLFEDPLFRVEALRSQDPVALFHLRRLIGDPIQPLLKEVVDRLVSDGDRRGLLELVEVMDEEGQLDEWKSFARTRSDPVINDVLAIQHHSRQVSKRWRP